MIRKPKDTQSLNVYNQSTGNYFSNNLLVEKRKEKVQFKIIKHATQSSKNSSKNVEESKSGLDRTRTHKGEVRKYETLDVPDFSK